ncbi:MAG TPA: folylpolyglutamate synthase/dihydrofolate synthase family protein [Oscillospiraceae bacterium]|nr:folylpolyglutamate synthase/dihydrofolate synthase family protein [Oscillospiraceae bacterium]
MEFSEAMNFINSFSKRGRSVTDLSRFEALMKKLGNPQDKLKFIHVAGTNGKGSCIRYCAAVLTEAGYKTGEFTSPFIVDYTDRIKIDGENISYKEIGNYIEKIIPAAYGNSDYSQFEITTALAFLYFEDQKCDVVCLETGVGGLLDSTNIIKNPLVSVIMSVSFDHTSVLGHTIKEIAFQKAGIIKNACPSVLSADNEEEAIEVVRKAADKMNSKLIIPQKSDIEIIKSDIFGNTFKYKNSLYELSMGGKHQIFNAVSAIEALNVLKQNGFEISYDNIKSGLKKAAVPSRTEIISENPLIMIDGAHNPSGMSALSDMLKNFPKKPVAVLGMLKEKDVKESLKNIAPYIEYAVCLDGFNPGAVNASELKGIFEDLGCKAFVGEDIETAVKNAIKNSAESGVVFCGSLYLTSVIRKIIKSMSL